jgi:hypothetical protein
MEQRARLPLCSQIEDTPRHPNACEGSELEACRRSGTSPGSLKGLGLPICIEPVRLGAVQFCTVAAR